MPTRIRTGVRIGAMLAATEPGSGFGAERSGRPSFTAGFIPRNQIGAGAPRTAAWIVGTFETRYETRLPPRLTP